MTVSAPPEVHELVARFREHAEAYRAGRYHETQLRREFIDPLFSALGWDMDNSQGYAEAYKDVIHEDAIKVGGATKAPDYCFRIGGVRKFFVEAKAPGVDLRGDPEPAYQLRRYAWSAKLPLSILTDFEELAVYDCRVRPHKNDKPGKARTLYLRYDELPERWGELASIFTREAILKGAFDKYVASSRRKRGTAEVDEAFLTEIEGWRDVLARNVALRNPSISQRDLNFAVQRTIDRIVFLRICEDRGIEPYGTLQGLLNGPGIYPRLFERFRRADERYNSGLFHFEVEKDRPEAPDDLTPGLALDDKPLKDILTHLYYPESPYEFSVLPADILGQVYEQFLGKVIRLTPGHRAVVEEKPEVRKAGGVYYTPTYVVDYIVRRTVGPLLEGCTPREVGGLTQKYQPSRAKGARPIAVLDPACGSGSFLLGVYQFLLDWHRDWYVQDGPEKHARGKAPRLYQHRSDQWRLTTAERKRILRSHIYGVDIDSQAVETTKLSLLLKVLEDETAERLDAGLRLFHERALPDLSGNIKCGNSLIGPDFYNGYNGRQLSMFDEDDRLRINVFDWSAEFADILGPGGFDAVIGNPPYVRMELFEPAKDYLRSHYKTHEERADLYAYFIERGLTLLRAGGGYGVIVSNKFIRAKYGRPLRQFICLHAEVEDIVDLAGARVFQGATVRSVILIARRGSAGEDAATTYAPVPSSESLKAMAAGTESLVDHVEAMGYALPDGAISSDVWATNGTKQTALLEKMKDRGIPLRKHLGAGAMFGLKTGCNDAFIVGGGTAEQFMEADAEAREFLMPILLGRDIRRYCIEDRERFVIHSHAESGELPPVIRTHLDTFRGVLKARAGAQRWFELQQPAVSLLEYRNAPKIVYPIIANECRFMLDTHGFLINDKAFLLPTSDVALLGILNSRPANFYFSAVCAALEGPSDRYLEFRAQYVDPFPVPPLDSKQRRHLVSLAGAMMQLHEERARARTAHARTAAQRQIDATDRQIDRLVYDLYGLTEDEVRVVEDATEQVRPKEDTR